MKKYKSLDEFFDDLKEPRKSEVEALRKIILDTESSLKEHLKWNAPSYSYLNEDRITFNLFNEDVTRLVFHAGASKKEDKKSPPIFKDKTKLLDWNSNIRATMAFNSLEQIHKHKQDISKIVKKWLSTFE